MRSSRLPQILPQIHVVGIGLDGVQGLSPSTLSVVQGADLLVGDSRHLSYFPQHSARRLAWGQLSETLKQLESELQAQSEQTVVILASGDPLFFGIGRLLLNTFLPKQLTFHPQPSSVQLAFSRIKQPWQDAKLLSIHGRSPEQLIHNLRQQVPKLAVIGDPKFGPLAMSQLFQSLGLGHSYRLWLCENLGGPEERVRAFWPDEITNDLDITPLHLWIAIRQALSVPEVAALPAVGIPDRYFEHFADRPGLITKRPIRTMILSELDLNSSVRTVWDIGAGTGSVSVEIARLVADADVWAIERTAAGQKLIDANRRKFRLETQISAVSGAAPEALTALPDPDRIFIGGSGGQLIPILSHSLQRLSPEGRAVAAITTLENLGELISWLSQRPCVRYSVTQISVTQSVPIAKSHRLAPLNPVSLITIIPHKERDEISALLEQDS